MVKCKIGRYRFPKMKKCEYSHKPLRSVIKKVRLLTFYHGITTKLIKLMITLTRTKVYRQQVNHLTDGH